MSYLVKLAQFGQKFLRSYGKVIFPVVLLVALGTPGVLLADDPVMAIPQGVTTTVTQGSYLDRLEEQGQGLSNDLTVTQTNEEVAAQAAAAEKKPEATPEAPGADKSLSAIGLVTEPFNFIVLSLAGLFNFLAGGVGWMIVTLIKIILIPILSYNDWATSRIIGLGWSLVRDVVNMFVVVILLVIAVMTIVGSPKANWEQQIPRLFIYVIAVNFSRTICGLLLDVGNVVMFQFVNAILDVGAGNFAQLLKLNVMGSFAKLSGDPALAGQLLASAYLQLAMLLVVLAIIGIMVIVFIYRIVVLWVLIIMSPAAFFMGGIKDVLGQAGSAYSMWWKKFSSAIILGPMLTFFLWLALAAASSGDIVASENFPTGGVTETTPGMVLESFDMSQLTGLFLGLVLLVVGMQQAAQAAGSLGGVAASFINEGMGMRIMKGALRMPAQQFGRQVNRGLSPVKGGTLSGELGKQLIASGAELRGSRFNKATMGLLGTGIIGKGLSEAGSALQGAGDAQLHESQHNAEERVKGWSNERLASELALVTGGEEARLLSGVDAQNAAIKRLLTEKSTQEKLEHQLNEKYKNSSDPGEGKRRFQAAMRGAIAKGEAHDGHLLGDDEKTGAAFNDTKTRYVNLIGALGGDSASKRQRAHLDSDKTDLRKMGTDAAKDQGIRSHLNSLFRVTDDGKEISKLEDMRDGKYGDKLKDAARATPNASTAQPDPDYAPGAARARTLTESDVDAVQTAVAGGALPLGHAAPGALNARDFGGTSTTVTYEDNAGATVYMPIGQVMARAIMNSGQDLSEPSNEMDTSAKAQFNTFVTNIIANPNTTKGDRRKALKARFVVDKGASAARFTFTGPNGGDELNALQDIVRENPAALRHFAAQIATPGDVQKAVTDTVSHSMMRDMGVRAAKLNPRSGEYGELRDAVQAMKTAINAQAALVGVKVTDAVKKKNDAIDILSASMP